MIPLLNNRGELPPGVHRATLKELKVRFGQSSPERKELFSGLMQALNNLEKAGVHRVYIDGGFITKKENPNDIDGCWDAHEDIDFKILDPVFLDRRKMREKYGVDFFISDAIELGSGYPFKRFFQQNKDGQARGIIEIQL